MPLVSVILVSCNDERWLKGCLNSLKAQTFKDFEVILVDNGSTDRSVELANEIYPGIRVVKLDKNYGLTAAYNVGMKVSRGTFLATLHNDVTLDERWLESLVTSIQRNPDYFLLGSMESTPEIPFPSYVDMNSWLNYVRFPCDDSVDIVPTAYVSGTCLFFRREALERLGEVFDARLGTYAYDDEISVKTLLSLGKIGYACRSRLWHYGGGTASRVLTVKRAAYLRNRNKVLALFESLRFSTFVKALIVLIALEVLRFITRAKDVRGNIHTFLGLLNGIALLPTMAKRRRDFFRVKLNDDKAFTSRLVCRTVTQRLIKRFLLG